MKTFHTRRQFIQRSAVGAAGFYLMSHGLGRAAISPNEKLNIAVIGVHNRAAEDLHGVRDENIVALCDVDERYLAEASREFPKAATYTDFRRALDRNDIDAVVVGTPDHTHAVISMTAIRSGRHVYCEKPLAHTIAEVRAVTQEAHKRKLVTQIGTQIHAGSNYRRVVELVQSGAIGAVREVHVWVGANYGNVQPITEFPEVPAGLHYDSWLGPIEPCLYSPEYVPFKWRNWWSFGGGSLADMGCHHFDLSHWALGLEHPTSVETEGPPVNAESVPPWLIARYEYPERPGRDGQLARPAVKLTWYHGGKRPHHFGDGLLPKWGDGTLFVGEKGMLLASYDSHVLLPEKDFAGFSAPTPTIPESIGHHREWVEACKGRGKTTCGFDYSGPLTEAVLLGNVSYRSSSRIEWDWKRMRATNHREAEKFVEYDYRKGWKL